MKKLLALLLALTLVLTLCACGKEEKPQGPEIDIDPVNPEGTTESSVAGSGTMDDPWQIGAGDPASVTAYLSEDWLFIDGDGDIMDFETPEERPWHNEAAKIQDISIFGQIRRIGKNAFKGAGTEADFFSCYLGEVKEYGESCFEGAGFDTSFILCLYDYVTKIESKAFADCGIDEIQIYGKSCEIADDAFAGLEANFYTMARDNWTDAEKKDFGGKMDYKLLYVFAYNDIYDTEDVSGGGEMYVPEDWPLDYDAAMNDDSEFLRYELVSGELEFDETDPFIGSYMTSDVEMNIYYHYVEQPAE